MKMNYVITLQIFALSFLLLLEGTYGQFITSFEIIVPQETTYNWQWIKYPILQAKILQPTPRRSNQFKVLISESRKNSKTARKEKINEIPTMIKITPPKIRSKNERQRKYSKNAPIGDLKFAHYLLEKPPFFETFDHAQTILALNDQRRKNNFHSTLFLLSMRPYFPFFKQN